MSGRYIELKTMTDKEAGPPRVSSGVPGLDAVLGGGLLHGAAYIVQGPPGAGKTILANQLCFTRAARGEKALYVSLLAEAHDRLLSFLRPMRFFDASFLPERIVYLSAFPILQKEGPAALQRLLVEEIRRRGATFVVVDGLFVIHDLLGSEPEFRRFVNEIQGVASLTQSTLLMLTNQSRERSAPEYTMVDGWIELLDEIQEARAIRAVVVHKQRGSAYLRGRHMFRISSDGIAVFPRLEAAQSREPAAFASTSRISSGIEQFDTMLQGGYPAASATLILGPSGSGKTTFSLQFLAGCTPEAPGLMFGFYEPPARLATKAQRIGADLEALVAKGAVHLLWQPIADNLADELGWRLIEAVRRTGAKRVVVDGIGGFERALLFRRRLPALINAINNTLRPLGATILYTRETQELHALQHLHADDLSAKSENLVLLHYERQDRVLRRMAAILKLRDSDFDPVAEEYYITDQGIHFGQRPPPQGRPSGVADTPVAAPPGKAARPAER